MIKLKKYHELDDLQKLTLINMSYSRFDTYKTCAAKYFYTYIQKEDRVFGEAATLGNVVHEALENSTGQGELDLDHMRDMMQEAREKYDPDHQISDKLVKAGEIMLEEFHERHQDDPFFVAPENVIAQELPFDIIVGACRIIGYIDLVYKDHYGNVIVCDYKSGSWQVPDAEVPTNLQLGIYALALSQLYPEQESFYAELYYLRDGKRKGHNFTTEDLERVCEEILSTYQDILTSVERGFIADAPPFKCKYLCDFGKNGVCGRGKYIIDRG